MGETGKHERERQVKNLISKTVDVRCMDKGLPLRVLPHQHFGKREQKYRMALEEDEASRTWQNRRGEKEKKGGVRKLPPGEISRLQKNGLI